MLVALLYPHQYSRILTILFNTQTSLTAVPIKSTSHQRTSPVHNWGWKSPNLDTHSLRYFMHDVYLSNRVEKKKKETQKAEL